MLSVVERKQLYSVQQNATRWTTLVNRHKMMNVFSTHSTSCNIVRHLLLNKCWRMFKCESFASLLSISGCCQPNNGICYSGMVRKICNLFGRTRRSQEPFFVYKFYFYLHLSWYFRIRDLVHYFTENSSQKFKAYPCLVSSVHKDMMKWRAEDEGRMKKYRFPWNKNIKTSL